MKNKILIAELILLSIFLLSPIFLLAQDRNLSVEGDGDQMGVIHSTNSGSAGLELIRGDSNADTDWRILNDNGNFRIQSETDNFMTNGTNRFSFMEDGSIGVGCTNPQAKLSICNGELAFSNAFSESAADKISLDGYAFDQPHMVGLGYETSTYFDPTGPIVQISDLYFKAEGAHRWYTNSNADLGSSATMVLNREGDLGLGTHTPDSRFQITGGSEASLTGHGYVVLGSTSSQNLVMDANEVQARSNGNTNTLFVQPAGGDLAVDGNTIYVDASTNEVGISTASPQNKLHVMGGSDLNLASGGYIQMGNSTSTNMVMDNNEILTRNNGVGATMYMQYDGGDLLLCGLENGQVGIGITSAANLPDPSYLLAVDGRIISEEVRVDLSGNWPDYVFENDYKLLSIKELEKSIKENGHLPGIPSAAEVSEEGLLLGDMQKRMMEKIEELTLYIIQQQKEIDQLKSQLETKLD